MVTATSDSNNTLVSLGNNNSSNGLKRVSSSLEVLRSSPATQSCEFEPSALLAPLDDDDFSFDDYSCGAESDDSSDDSFYSCYSPSVQAQQQQPIYLPTKTRNADVLGVDECLKCIPQIMERCDELLAVEPVRYTKKSPEQVLHVGQGEVAHATPSQCDVILSDKATTCHILALRSTSTSASSEEPLVSLCHIDSASYDACIRSMFERHVAHHGKTGHKVSMDVHIVGGFNDAKGTSRDISNWLITLLADLAFEFQEDNMQVTLQTCAISSMNESGHQSPIGRGLAVHLQSGQAFLASCDEHVAGPDLLLRAVRLWCPPADGSPKQLSLIHSEESTAVTVEPFDFSPFPEINRLLALPDHILIQYCSTSPDCEEDDFCPFLRRTLHFLRTTKPSDVFGCNGGAPRVYQRCSSSSSKQARRSSLIKSNSTNYSNTWKLANTSP